ncbi:MAG: Stp1/IreP family PP2C-type Ser/Thr phosphatase [Clostridiaceae bacterium]|nr:Stp1/IreP family PP2C-type Ser/Thr phosphatase [Clostridiaceae bacterium]
MRLGAFTDKGRAREINEDNFFVSEPNEASGARFCIIADGMGGHNAGEVASKMAIDEMRESIRQLYRAGMSDSQIIEVLKESMWKANAAIYYRAFENKLCAGMGTTAIVCFVNDRNAYIAHVGDSRAYLIRDKTISQITTDHSVVEELINSGTITREEAVSHPQRHVITRALGADKDIDIDIYVHKYISNDIILICTDGLTNMLNDSEIFEIIDRNQDLQCAVEELVLMANNKGGLDNITAVAIGL